jgi:hypothetical protein
VVSTHEDRFQPLGSTIGAAALTGRQALSALRAHRLRALDHDARRALFRIVGARVCARQGLAATIALAQAARAAAQGAREARPLLDHCAGPGALQGDVASGPRQALEGGQA